MRRGAVRDRARDQQELAADPARRRADSVQTTPTERELLHRPSEVGQMVTHHPGAVPGRHVLALQRSIGNRAVASLLVGRHSSAQTATEDLEDETAPERTVPTAAVEHPDASAPERASEATPATVPGDPVARPGSHLR
ncbi:MAG TPA: hypothetical protein VNE21_04985, partial [Mycobacteriales bacterium]|nr:hypothetical protein [Mycobacteriales bacterium]